MLYVLWENGVIINDENTVRISNSGQIICFLVSQNF
jgi:hypothetical protein